MYTLQNGGIWLGQNIRDCADRYGEYSKTFRRKGDGQKSAGIPESVSGKTQARKPIKAPARQSPDQLNAPDRKSAHPNPWPVKKSACKKARDGKDTGLQKHQPVKDLQKGANVQF